MYWMFLLLMLHYQLDLCAAYPKKKIFCVLDHVKSRVAIHGRGEQRVMSNILTSCLCVSFAVEWVVES